MSPQFIQAAKLFVSSMFALFAIFILRMEGYLSSHWIPAGLLVMAASGLVFSLRLIEETVNDSDSTT